jgi:hypothetical protein
MNNNSGPIFIVNPDSILQEGILKPAAKNSRNNVYNYKSYRLKKGVVIFRGGVKAGTDAPAFFGALTTAEFFSKGNDEKIYGYRVRKEPKLLQLSYANLITLFENDERLTEIERAALDKYLVVSDDQPPYVVPVDFLLPEDKVGEGRYPLYLNRRILNMVCRLGYDGWVVLPGTLIQRNLDTEYFMKKGKVRYQLNPYNTEVALCAWDEFLEEIKL